MDNYQLQQNQQNSAFPIASMCFGIASIVMCCTGILPLPLGGLGILFAILSKRKDQPMHSMSTTGITLSCIGIVLGLIILIHAIYLIMTDPQYQQLFEEMMQYYNQSYQN